MVNESKEFTKTIKITLTGGDADNHLVKLSRLLDTLNGFNDLVSNSIYLLENDRLPTKKKDIPEYKIMVYAPRAQCLEILIQIDLSLLPVIREIGVGILVDLLGNIIFSRAGETEEAQKLANKLALKKIERKAKEDKRRHERKIKKIEMDDKKDERKHEREIKEIEMDDKKDKRKHEQEMQKLVNKESKRFYNFIIKLSKFEACLNFVKNIEDGEEIKISSGSIERTIDFNHKKAIRQKFSERKKLKQIQPPEFRSPEILDKYESSTSAKMIEEIAKKEPEYEVKVVNIDSTDTITVVGSAWNDQPIKATLPKGAFAREGDIYRSYRTEEYIKITATPDKENGEIVRLKILSASPIE